MRIATFGILSLILGCTPHQATAQGQDRGAAQADPRPGGAKPAADPKVDKDVIIGAAPVDPKSYLIGPEDVLLIRVWREPELSGQFMVRPDGKISLPLINELQAGGITPAKLNTQITEALGKYMTRPEVTVVVQQVNSKKFYIQGEVNRPGAYPLVVPTTVLEALVNAGGFKDFANTKKIVILRGSERLKFNYKDVVRGKNLDQNIQVQNGDQIIVP